MRSSTGSGSAPGPALKLNARFALRSDVVEGLTIEKSLAYSFRLFRYPLGRSETSRIAEVLVRRACPGVRPLRDEFGAIGRYSKCRNRYRRRIRLRGELRNEDIAKRDTTHIS